MTDPIAPLSRYADPNDPANGPKYHSGKPCIELGCEKPAGTAWSPHWCFRHNAERMARIDRSMDELAEGFGL